MQTLYIFIGIIPYIIVLLVLLRKQKMPDILKEQEPKSTKKEKIRLGIVGSVLTIAFGIIFINGLGDLYTQSSGAVITSYSGTFINQASGV